MNVPKAGVAPIFVTFVPRKKRENVKKVSGVWDPKARKGRSPLCTVNLTLEPTQHRQKWLVLSKFLYYEGKQKTPDKNFPLLGAKEFKFYTRELYFFNTWEWTILSGHMHINIIHSCFLSFGVSKIMLHYHRCHWWWLNGVDFYINSLFQVYCKRASLGLLLAESASWDFASLNLFFSLELKRVEKAWEFAEIWPDQSCAEKRARSNTDAKQASAGR